MRQPHLIVIVTFILGACLPTLGQQSQPPGNSAPAPANQTNLTFGPGGIIPSAGLTANTFSASNNSIPEPPANPACRRFNAHYRTNSYPANYGGTLPSNIRVLPGAYTTYGGALPANVTQAPGWETTIGGPTPSFIRTTNSPSFTYGGPTPDFIRIGGAPPNQ